MMLKVDRSKLLDMYHYATLSTPISNKKIYIITILENCNRNQSSSGCLKCDFDLLYLLQKQDLPSQLDTEHNKIQLKP